MLGESNIYKFDDHNHPLRLSKRIMCQAGTTYQINVIKGATFYVAPNTSSCEMGILTPSTMKERGLSLHSFSERQVDYYFMVPSSNNQYIGPTGLDGVISGYRFLTGMEFKKKTYKTKDNFENYFQIYHSESYLAFPF